MAKLVYAKHMEFLYIAPRLEVKPDRIHGRTAWAAQLLVLFAYCRSVTVDRARQKVLITTRWFWLFQTRRVIPFDRVGRIVYRAQSLPSLSPMRYLTLALQGSDICDSAVFLIAIAFKDAADDKRARNELTLFSVWEQQPRANDWIDSLAGVRTNARIGDETAGAIVDLLHDYLGVPIASH
jgi:hypothetical protein